MSEIQRPLSEQVAQNAERWVQPELFPEDPKEQRIAEWIGTYVTSGLLEDYEALEVLSDWRRAQVRGERDE